MRLQAVFRRSFLLLFCSLARIFAVNVIMDGPSNLTVEPGQWGIFNCTISCTHFVNWYVEGMDVDDIATSCDSLDGKTACMEEVQSCVSDTSTTGLISRLRILAIDEYAGMDIAVQCGAIGRNIPSPNDPCPLPFLSYSRFRSLRVRPLPEVTTVEAPTTTQEEPSTLPSPTPVVCPSVTADVTTVTEVVTEIVTSTVFVPSTVTISATPTDLPNFHSRASTTHNRSHFGKVVTDLLTWFVTVMTGIVFL